MTDDWRLSLLATLCGVLTGLLLPGCAYRPPAPVLSGERCMPATVVRAQADDAQALADTLFGWAVPLALSGSAALPAGAALGSMQPWERAGALAAPLGTLAVSAVLFGTWASANHAAAQWASGLGCTPGDARSLWSPPVESVCTDPACP